MSTSKSTKRKRKSDEDEDWQPDAEEAKELKPARPRKTHRRAAASESEAKTKKLAVSEAESAKRGPDDVSYAAEILEGKLWLSDEVVAQDEKQLKTLGITHVLRVMGEEPKAKIEGIVYMHLPIEDSTGESITKYFEGTSDFIDNALKASGKVLVHCQMGISRSATIVIAYLTLRQNAIFKTLDEAWNHVDLKRDCVMPNRGFRNQLRSYFRDS